jgi:hypothetical protein
MTRGILTVHGIGQYRALPAGERAIQMTAAHSEALGHPVTAVYYAHLLRDPDRQGAPGLAGLTADEYAILDEWVTALGIPAEVTQGYPALPVRLVADWIARHIARTDDNAAVRRVVRLLTGFARDAASYFNHPDRRRAVQDHLAAAIATHRPEIIIAHSLGTVVAYETLWTHPALTDALLVTLGSPLAMPGAIFDRLQPGPVPDVRTGHGTRPPHIHRWINLADPGDIVAIPRPLHHRFSGIHPDDDHTGSIGALAVHSFTGYLRSPVIRASLTS